METGRKRRTTSRFTRLFSSLIASSRTQNRVPSMIARTPVFLPALTRLSNSLVSTSLPSTANIDSFTREAWTVEQGAWCSPAIFHSETPYGALTEVALAASTKCSEMMLMTHSPVSVRFFNVSFAFSRDPTKPTANRGGSWLMTCE
ncbi:hypothetical protein VTN96DRAFT_4852 [Rasamsonia emersonii]